MQGFTWDVVGRSSTQGPWKPCELSEESQAGHEPTQARLAVGFDPFAMDSGTPRLPGGVEHSCLALRYEHPGAKEVEGVLPGASALKEASPGHGETGADDVDEIADLQPRPVVFFKASWLSVRPVKVKGGDNKGSSEATW